MNIDNKSYLLFDKKEMFSGQKLLEENNFEKNSGIYKHLVKWKICFIRGLIIEIQFFCFRENIDIYNIYYFTKFEL